MRHPVSRLLTLVLTVGLCTLAPGQPPQPPEGKKPSQLEQMLDDALRNNPDIRVGEAKLREAAAELNRTRLLVAEKVVKLQSELEMVRSKIKAAEAMLRQTQQRFRQGVSTAEEVQVAEANFMTAKAELAKLEAEVPALLGKRTGVEALAFTADGNLLLSRGADGVVRVWDVKPGAVGPGQPPTPQLPTHRRLKEALDAVVEVKFDGVPITDALQHLLEGVGDIPLVVRLEEKGTITLKSPVPIPLGAALQMVQDQYPGRLELVVRDYGVLVTEKKNLPPDALTVHEFWKLADRKDAKGPKQ